MQTIEQKLRLLKLARTLSKIPEEHFDLGLITTACCKEDVDQLKEIAKNKKHMDCGSAACAIGWMPAAFPDKCKWSNVGDVVLVNNEECKDFSVAEELFGLNDDEMDYLFMPIHYPECENTSVKEVVNRINECVLNGFPLSIY